MRRQDSASNRARVKHCQHLVLHDSEILRFSRSSDEDKGEESPLSKSGLLSFSDTFDMRSSIPSKEYLPSRSGE
eukprot:760359-Hanusia_phi.AAC.3